MSEREPVVQTQDQLKPTNFSFADDQKKITIPQFAIEAKPQSSLILNGSKGELCWQ